MHRTHLGCPRGSCAAAIRPRTDSGAGLHRATACLLWLLAVTVPACATETAPARPQAAFGLEGEWYVLVHYRDESGENPELGQWRDRVWRFEREEAVRGGEAQGEQGEDLLRWTILDGVKFRDARGRFEVLDGDRSARSPGFWQPDAQQIAEIRAGLQVDVHGARSKALHGSPQRGYRSAGQRSARSSSTIGYAESWQIDGLPSAPVFVRVDSMGSGRTSELAGRTRFATRSVAPGGDELSGDFDQDGVLAGRFRMLRMAERGGDG